jgi:glycosyltransferase involved in cell wall biosynthesis
MHILIVHQYYLMPGQSGGSRFNEMAKAWADEGHEVTVIAGTVDYTTGQKPAKYAGRWLTRETDGPITIWRCHVPSCYNTSYSGRMWAFLGFTFSSATAAVLARRADVVIATSPPLIAAVPGWIAAKALRRRIPYIFEIRDLWPESAITTGVLKADSPMARLLYKLERWACSRADLINVLTPAFKQDILHRGLTSRDKVIFVPNGADLRQFAPAERENSVRREFGWGDRCVMMYAGAHGRANALGQLLETADLLRHRSDVLIAFVGDGPERETLQNRSAQMGLKNVMFCGPQAKDRMPAFVNACDAGLAVLQNNPTFRTVYPNKVFDYMACEKPTVLAIDGVARELVCDDVKAGVFATPEDPKSLMQAVLLLADSPKLRRDMGRRGREWVIANASREALSRRYLDAMLQLAKPSSSVAASV